MTIDVPTSRGPAHDAGAGQIEPTLPGLGPDPAQPPYASWGRRIFAYLLDAAIVSAVTFLAVGPAGAPTILPIFTPTAGQTATVTDSGWLLATALALAVLQAYAGWTPGKRTVGIVVVREETGRPAGLLATVLRWLAHVLDAILLIGFLRPLWNAQRKTFADSLLHTVVVISADAPAPHPWVAALRDRLRSRGPGPDGAPRLGGRRASTVVTASATLVCVTASAFALTPSTIEGGDVWQADCTPLVEPGASTAPLRFESVGIVSWSVPVSETRWGVTRTAPPAVAPAFAPADADGLEATYVVEPAPGAPAGVPVDAELVLALSTWDGDPILARSSAVRVTPEADGTVTSELLSGSPDGGDVETVRVDAPTVTALPPAWHWDASLRIDGATVAACGGRGSA